MTHVRWTINDCKLVSTGGNDTSIVIWNNLAYVNSASGSEVAKPDSSPNKRRKSLTKANVNEIIQKNSRRGESEDSDTDSEHDGYDSDVKREQEIDYSNIVFNEQIKRPTAEIVNSLYKEVTSTDKM